jgi:tRNA dimethylallyltransferase
VQSTNLKVELQEYELITVLGPTASGKTAFATRLANELNSEIISADSRQVYRNMTIGTGKDLDNYIIEGKFIPYHLIDICQAGEKYNVFRFQHDFHEIFTKIKKKGKLPILCGGTGLYIESVLKGYKLLDVPENLILRSNLKDKSVDELKKILKSYKNLHNQTDTDSVRKIIRAIEIETCYPTQKNNPINSYSSIKSLIIGVNIDRELRRNRISLRLKKRLEEGMIEEVKNLLETELSPDQLIYYGLEYKYITLYLIGQLSYSEMYQQLEIAIHQYAKRQMTWFRGMERRGFKIHWIDVYEMNHLNEIFNRIHF